MSLESIIFILFAVALSVGGDFYLKKSGGLHSINFFYGIALYALSAVPAALAFKKVQFGVVFIVWESLMIILGLIIGSTYFKEPVTSHKIVALFLSLVAIFFVYK